MTLAVEFVNGGGESLVSCETAGVQLTKHHALGNDFLVLIDLDDDCVDAPERARRVCDRHTGIGADGLLRLRAGDGQADLTMELYNADGGRAEMSGNGISCLVQAAFVAGLATGPDVVVRTDAGLRNVEIEAAGEPGTHSVTVDMGEVVVGAEATQWLGEGVEAARFADAGNPHLVLHTPDPASAPDLVAVGEAANRAIPGGVNVELVSGDGDLLCMAVYERGVGPTLACGTGAAASAVVAAEWGLTGDQVRVAMPGGTAAFTLGSSVKMAVPVVAIARIDTADV